MVTTEPSAVSTLTSAFLTGLMRVRCIRRIGWLPWHDADTSAFRRAFQPLLEAAETHGLLTFAVVQLVRNAGCRARKAGTTWFGRFRRRVRTV